MPGPYVLTRIAANIGFPFQRSMKDRVCFTGKSPTMHRVVLLGVEESTYPGSFRPVTTLSRSLTTLKAVSGSKDIKVFRDIHSLERPSSRNKPTPNMVKPNSTRRQ